MKSSFIENPIEVANDLEALGLDREGLLEVVDKVVTARNNCTKNDVRGARGTQAYLTGTRVLRDLYLVRGWEKCDAAGMECIINRERGVKVVMVNSDASTGLNLEGRLPQNRNRKGPATDFAVLMNHQLNFGENFGTSENLIRLGRQQGGVQHWFLMIYAQGDEVRAELSYPESFKDGYFAQFRKRIILIGDGDQKDAPVKVRDSGADDAIEYEIPVIRKQA